MPVFSYKALTPGSKKPKGGILDAENPRAARDKLKAMGLFPVEIVQEHAEEVQRPTNGKGRWFSPKLSQGALAILTRQLATLLKAGLPLIDALKALEDQTENASQRRVLSQIKDKVLEGSALADALGRFPRAFPELYVNMVRSGEFTGRLDTVLERLAEHLEKQQMLKSRLVSKLAYPAFILLTSLGILTLLLLYVVPKVGSIFDQLGENLPLPTRILLGGSSFLQNSSPYILGFFILGGILLNRGLKTPSGRRLFDRLVFEVPFVGDLIKKIAVARFSRTLGVLLSAGIPLLKALEITQPIMSNVLFKEAIQRCQEKIHEGGQVAQTLKESGLFPSMLVHMVAVGERSGELESMLLKVAESYETQTEATIETTMGLIEPIMILFMGGIVGFVVMSILLPIFEMNQLIQ